MRRQAGPTHNLAGPPARPARGAPATRAGIAQQVPVALGWQLTGGILTLMATTPRRGVSYSDSWSMSPSLALTSATVVDTSQPGQASYVSRAAIGDSSLAHDTTYTFSYAIVMRSGESAWAGSSSVTVTVGPDGSLPPPHGNACGARGRPGSQSGIDQPRS